ncbi:XkdX family protein [Clostridium haemolyticum]|nr:XkdX family protein [Clostridium haemolyticum]
MFDFYNVFYKQGMLKFELVKEACKWNCITKEEFKKITGQEYTED